MVKRNTHFAKLNAGYLFPEINKRKQAFLAKNPNAKLISLGIGDTTQPLPSFISQHLSKCGSGLGTKEGYSGYGAEQGNNSLRKKIAESIYQNQVVSEEVFVSDGAKCDIGRLQVLFGSQATIAVQDPTYPVYVDSGVILGQSGTYDPLSSGYHGIVYMPCLPENNFFPDLKKIPRTDLIFFCSPNNPTGAVATRPQLEQLVAFAKANRSIIIYDAAYSAFIEDSKYPKTIYEIEGAREVAIEVSSFSKMAGFTGVRLGWTVVPFDLKFEDGTPVRKDWERIQTTLFNGASNLAQHGGESALSPEGLASLSAMIDYYKHNARLIKQGLEQVGVRVFGGENAPYIWAQFPGTSSWNVFEDFLEKAQVITTPGSGFGPAGESFIRFSAFGHRDQTIEAIKRLQAILS